MDIRTSLSYPVASHLAQILHDAAEIRQRYHEEIGRVASETTLHGAHLNLAHYQIRATEYETQGKMIYGELMRTLRLLVALDQINEAVRSHIESIYWDIPTMRHDPKAPLRYPIVDEMAKRISAAPFEAYNAGLRAFFDPVEIMETNDLIDAEKRAAKEHEKAIQSVMYMGPLAMAQKLLRNWIKGYSKNSDRYEMAELIVAIDHIRQPLVTAQTTEQIGDRHDPQKARQIDESIFISADQAAQVVYAVSARLGRKLKGSVNS